LETVSFEMPVVRDAAMVNDVRSEDEQLGGASVAELSEEELSRVIRLEGVDQEFTIRSLLRPRDRRPRKAPACE
jgi:hypothetical protein